MTESGAQHCNPTDGNLGGSYVPDPRNPHPHDVLCGRGGQSNNHPGNEWFRRLVRSNRALYRSCPKHTKLLVAKAIVQAVQQQDPQGRFIKLKESQDSTKESVWTPITYTQAVNKTSQALREKESRDVNKNKKKEDKEQQQQHRIAQREAVTQGTASQEKNLEIAKEASNRVKVEGVQTPQSIANLTDATIQSAERSDKTGSSQQSQLQNRTTSGRMQIQQQAKILTAGEEQQNSTTEISQRVGQKRRIADSSMKPSWWRMGSQLDSRYAVSNTTSSVNSGSNSTAALGTIVTPCVDVNFNNEGGNKRIKFFDGVRNADAVGIEHDGVNHMGRAVVNQGNFTALTQPSIDAMPFPMETTLDSRQSTMSRFLNNTGLFGRGSSVTSAPRTGVANPSSATNTASFGVGIDSRQAQFQNTGPLQNALQSSLPSQQTTSNMVNTLQYQQEQRTSMPSFSSDQHMGKTSVQQLRPQQLQEQHPFPASGFEGTIKGASSVAGLEDELEEVPVSGLIPQSTGGSLDVVPPPPPKGLKTQMSDWLNSFFPPNTKDDGNYNLANDNIFDSSQNYNDDEGAAIPPPPGGVDGLGRSVSSTIFGLVESPSLFLTSLKSGVTSLFGDSVFSHPQAEASPIRRFPSAFQQYQMRQQQQQNVLQQQFGRNISDGGTMIGNHPVLGETSTRRASLLEDFEETPMERELRNAKR